MDGRSGSDRTPIYRDSAGRVEEGIVSVASDLTVSACNPTATEVLQRAESDLLGGSVWTLLTDADGTVAERRIDAALASDRQGSFEWYDHVSQTWFEVHVHPEQDGLSLRLTGLAAEGSRHRTGRPDERSGDAFGVGHWRIDLPSNSLFVSEEVLRIRGLPPEYDLSLEEGLGFYHPQDRPILREAMDRLEAAGETYDLELREVRADGEINWVRTTGVPVYEDDEVVALKGVYRDVTDRKENELELQRKTREIQRQNERLDRFASVLSHDLRNPLAVAQGRLELAREVAESDHYDEIETALAWIETLIDDVLRLARQGAAVSDPEPVDVAAVAEECWEAVDDADAELVLRSDATILADRGRLRQLLGNLARNAVEHGGETVTVGDLEDGFYVADDGPGIPPAKRGDVFDVGYSTSATGTGYGLPIVKEIADAHRWRVRIVESPESGAAFEFVDVETA